MTLPDLALLLTADPFVTAPSLLTQLTLLIVGFSPFRKPQKEGLSTADVKRRELHARANLAMAETVGWVVVGAFQTQRGTGQADGWAGDDDTNLRGTTRLEMMEEDAFGGRSAKAGRRRRRSSDEDGVAVDMSIEDLERRRGGSPRAERTRVQSQRRYSSSPGTADQRPDRFSRPPGSDDDPLAGVHADRLDDVAQTAGRVVGTAQDMVMHSENEEGWWMYVSMVGVVMVALGLGMIG